MTSPHQTPIVPPLVSVLLPVYNAGPYLGEAIESILDQSLREIELFIIDDCSTDDSLIVARRYEAADQRVSVLVNDRNRGRSYSDNRGHELSRGRYIAKMDADDIALPHRLKTQFDFLEAHPEVMLTGSFLEAFGNSQIVFEYPISAEAVRGFLLFDMPVGNPSVFFRRSLVADKSMAYDEKILDTFGEDYEWIARVSQVATIENQPEVLLRYRTFPTAQKASVHARRTAKANKIREGVLTQAGFQFSARELQVHNTIAHFPFQLGDITLTEVHAWLLSLIAQNEQIKYVEGVAFRRVLADRWFRTCYHNSDSSTDNYHVYYGNALAEANKVALKLKLKFWIKNKLLRRFK